ncbi:M48 family metallopeptidase [Salinispirillum sp. LH 10-3-1]|uniref:M48 family metallopeptidase n=1 Tax=Salinispirillum sp. LH 10-3-1 TaxID=2952525 RepID=A0AB38YIZ8_9GAMM
MVNQEGDQTLLNAPLDDLKVSSRIGRTARYLSHPEGKFETTDNDTIDAIVAAHNPGTRAGLAHRLESHKRFILLTLVGVAVFVWALVMHGIPWGARQVAFQVPHAVTQQLTRETLALMDRGVFNESQLSSTRQAEIMAHFAPTLERYGDLNLQVVFRDGGRLGANALAFPDGTVLFTDQLITLSQHDDELLAILAHEIGHVHYRHGLQSVIRGSIMGIAWVLVTGDTSATAELLLSAPLIFSELAYSRKFEFEADAFARHYLLERGLDLTHFERIMMRLTYGSGCTELAQCLEAEKEDDRILNQYLSTHPPTPERIRAFLAED